MAPKWAFLSLSFTRQGLDIILGNVQIRLVLALVKPVKLDYNSLFCLLYRFKRHFTALEPGMKLTIHGD